MADAGLDPGIVGSPNPLIIRNYRMIPPLAWKYVNLTDDANAFPGIQIYRRDVQLVFKVEAAPVVLPYESELVLKYTARSATVPPFLTNQWTPVPLYRIKAKSVSHIVKRCWATISNMTYQSVRTPHYLNEILLRKPAFAQIKYPDNYTGEKIAYSRIDGDRSTHWNPLEVTAGGIKTSNSATFLEPLTRTVPNENQLYFMTPQYECVKKTDGYYTTITFRIPFTELLPVFKIGVIPLVMIASQTFDLDITLFRHQDWYVDGGLGKLVALEAFLNISTCSFPDINPLAEAVIRPKIFGDRFIAPYLDYLVFEQVIKVPKGTTRDVYFNITQSLRNVPFFALTFFDNSDRGSTRTADTNERAYSLTAAVVDDTTMSGPAGIATTEHARALLTGEAPMTLINRDARERGGFFSLPPGVSVHDTTIMLGESTFPLTQVPMSWDDMYMYNRKHFEMYGRDFNIYRVSPIGRAYSGDASFFFDLSHSPMTGFQIGPGSPLQTVFKITNASDTDADLTVSLVAYYSNNMNTMLASGGVVSLQP